MLRRVFCREFWASNSVICLGCVLGSSGCAFLYGFSYLIKGVPLFSPFLGLSGRGFGVCFFLSPLFLLLLPPFFLGAGLGSLSFSSACLSPGLRCLDEAGQAQHVLILLAVSSFLFSLPGSAPLSLALSLSFFSLSLSLFLSLLHASA